jgi:hypothetical protein
MFVEDDIARVADLHRRVFNTTEAVAGSRFDAYDRYLRDVFLRPEVGDHPIQSLVCDAGQGAIVGFLGLVPRRMRFGRQPILAAVCSQFIVDSARRGQTGLLMLKRCFQGPQDVSITDEANDATRTIWEWCGGSTAMLYSLHWMRPIRPVQFMLALASRRERWQSIAGAATRAAARIADAGIARLLGGRPTQGVRAELDLDTLSAWLPEFTRERSLGPDYDHASLQWVLGRARRAYDHLRAAWVRGADARPAGWYLFSVDRARIAHVVQIGARPHTIDLVLDHLFDDAARHGAAALSGRLDPAFAQHLSDRHCVFRAEGQWTLVHARRPEIVEAVQRGDAFLTRLEGEWCLRFH